MTIRRSETQRHQSATPPGSNLAAFLFTQARATATLNNALPDIADSLFNVHHQA